MNNAWMQFSSYKLLQYFINFNFIYVQTKIYNSVIISCRGSGGNREPSRLTGHPFEGAGKGYDNVAKGKIGTVCRYWVIDFRNFVEEVRRADKKYRTKYFDCKLN